MKTMFLMFFAQIGNVQINFLFLQALLANLTGVLKETGESRRKKWAMLHRCSNDQKSAKNKITNFVKLTGHTYVCNSLTNFEYKGHAMTGNGTDKNLLNLV